MKIVFALLLAAACDDPGQPGRGAGMADAGALEGATFSRIYSEVIVASGCVLGLCHGQGASGGGLDLDPQPTAYDALVGVAAAGGECEQLELLRVEPGLPERSLLALKLSQGVPCGLRMPPGEPLSQAQVALVERWIARGAPND